MATKRTDGKNNRPTYKHFDVSVTPRPGRRDQQKADAAVAQFRAYYEGQRRAGVSPQAAYEAWLTTPEGEASGPNERMEVERAVAKLMLAWQMSQNG